MWYNTYSVKCVGVFQWLKRDICLISPNLNLEVKDNQNIRSDKEIHLFQFKINTHSWQLVALKLAALSVTWNMEPNLYIKTSVISEYNESMQMKLFECCFIKGLLLIYMYTYMCGAFKIFRSKWYHLYIIYRISRQIYDIIGYVTSRI